MQKLPVTQQEEKAKRNASFYKTMKKSTIEEIGQLPQLPIQEVKTLKMINKKSSRIPFLNLADLRRMERPKVASLGGKGQEKLLTERRATQINSQDVSFFLQQCDLLITKKNPNYSKESSTVDIKKSCIFPPILNHGHTSPAKFGKRLENRQNSNDAKRRGPRMKAHCKVLLAKHNDFPFIGSQIHETKRIDRERTKQSSNPEQIDFFDLDISRISEISEMPQLDFISQESFKQIPIF